MKKQLSYAFIALAALLCGCSKENIQDESFAAESGSKQETGGGKVSIQAIIESGAKSALTDENNFAWKDGETISVGTDKGKFETFTCEDAAEGLFSKTFSGTVPSLLVAVSPAQNGTFTATNSFQLTLPSAYTYTVGVTNNLMVGTPDAGSNTKFYFRHAAALLKITYGNVPAGTQALRLNLSNAGNIHLTGTVTVGGTSASDIQISNTRAGLDGDAVTIRLSSPTAVEQDLVFYIPVPTGDYPAKCLSTCLLDAQSAVIADSKSVLANALTLRRGDIYDMPKISLESGFTPYTVGSANNTDDFGASRSEAYAIPKGKILTLEFYNYSAATQNWYNWVLVLANKAYGADGYTEYLAFRADAWGWTPTATFDTDQSLRNNLTMDWTDWALFRQKMNGAYVTMSIENRSGVACIKASSLAADKSVTFTETYKFSIGAGKDIVAHLTTEHGHLDIRKCRYEDAEETEEDDSAFIPTYSDDYRSIMGWNDRARWNLANVHDPSVAYYKGYYYMYATDASYGNQHLQATTGRHFQGRRSSDLVNWSHLPGPMNDAPAWARDSLNAIRGRMGLGSVTPNWGYWAPVIRTVTVGGVEKLRMYYSLVALGGLSGGTFGNELSFIGMCESTDPSNPSSWVDKGYVVSSSSDKGRTESYGSSFENAYFRFNAIDPTYLVDDDGKHWLIYGSWHSGFAILEIDPASGKPKNAFNGSIYKGLGNPWGGNTKFGTRIATRVPGGNWARWQGSEAPEIIKKDGWYYMFMAYDELSFAYNTRVCRSSSINGPYYDIEGTNVTNGGDCFPIVTHPYKFSQGYGWVGISHCGIFRQEGTDDWFYCSQGRLPAEVDNALMMGHVRRLVWCPSSPDKPNDLWPLALPERYAGLSNGKIKSSEIAGTWEHINLGYQQGIMQGSNTLVLSANGTMSGALQGSWSYDESKNYLTLKPNGSTAVVVVVAREADWEASPRKKTLVYAGTAKGLYATWWGKKK